MWIAKIKLKHNCILGNRYEETDAKKIIDMGGKRSRLNKSGLFF